MANVIHLRDNTHERKTIRTNALEALKYISKIDFKDSKQCGDLLVWPKYDEFDKNEISELPILDFFVATPKIDGVDISKDVKKRGYRSVSVYTGNIMGFVGLGDTSVSIHSRFTYTDNDRYGEDYFLYHMLQRVFNINIFNLDHSFERHDKIMDFLLFMFPNTLKNALSQGLYKEYRSQEFDDARVRGTILVNKVIRNDIPFRGRISYRTRVHSYDNTITQLVRHTIEHIKRHPFGAAILNNDPETKEYVDKITLATPTYNPRDRDKVLKANLRPKIHPYFLKYKDLQELCVRILRHESLKYGEDKDKVHGILFDGAWLWEEYLYTILRDIGFEHPRNKERKGAVYMFRKSGNVEESEYPKEFDYFGQKMYPDFYLPSQNDTTTGKRADVILDAKYKRLDRNLGREDMFQVISYMHCMKADIGGYIYPFFQNNDTEALFKDTKIYQLNGYGGQLMTLPFQIPTGKNKWEDFQDAIKQSEENLKKEFEQRLITHDL